MNKSPFLPYYIATAVVILLGLGSAVGGAFGRISTANDRLHLVYMAQCQQTALELDLPVDQLAATPTTTCAEAYEAVTTDSIQWDFYQSLHDAFIPKDSTGYPVYAAENDSAAVSN